MSKENTLEMGACSPSKMNPSTLDKMGEMSQSSIAMLDRQNLRTRPGFKCPAEVIIKAHKMNPSIEALDLPMKTINGTISILISLWRFYV